MALTQNGINYICENFGDTNFCCVDTGLSWYYTVGGVDYPETGGTASIVGRLVIGLITSLTMTNPARGTFTQAQLNAANGQDVLLQDAQQIALHDTVSEGQWCTGSAPPPPCSDYTSQNDCEVNLCFWYNGSCHGEAQPVVICSDYLSQNDCVANGCFWYNNSCHSTAQPIVTSDNMWLFAAIGIAAIGLIGFILIAKRDDKEENRAEQ